jgi:DNA-binding transcriptional ArsR family regulator
VSIADLDPIIHAPKRLAVMALLAHSDACDFAFVRSHVGISDSDLSKQMSALEKAGYVKITKTGRGRGASTWYRITPAGKTAYTHHVKTLTAIVTATATGAP